MVVLRRHAGVHCGHLRRPAPPDLGIALPFSDTVAYFLFFGVYLAVTFVIFYFLRNRVEVTYALAYDSLPPREPENNGAVLGNIFQM